MKGLLIATLAFGTLSLAILPASAQGRSGDPNIGHFYMARQQWQILDDAPQIDDRRTNPAAAQQGMPQRGSGPPPLPRAGFMPYSSSLPSGMGAGLPQVVNGVPKKPVAPPPSIAARSARAGKYKPPVAPRPSGPVTAKTYAPYNGYGGGPAVSASSGHGNGTYGSSASSSTGVRGNLLHWSRTGSRSY